MNKRRILIKAEVKGYSKQRLEISPFLNTTKGLTVWGGWANWRRACQECGAAYYGWVAWKKTRQVVHMCMLFVSTAVGNIFTTRVKKRRGFHLDRAVGVRGRSPPEGTRSSLSHFQRFVCSLLALPILWYGSQNTHTDIQLIYFYTSLARGSNAFWIIFPLLLTCDGVATPFESICLNWYLW
jgi:hypothetical protein